jgi:cytochrome b561
MLIVNGIAILIAGVMNMSAGGGWMIFGMLQVIWGVQEMRKMREYE